MVRAGDLVFPGNRTPGHFVTHKTDTTGDWYRALGVWKAIGLGAHMYIDDAGGAAIGSTIGKSMSDFASGAASGAFAVNEAGGDALLAAIRDMAEWVDGEQASLHLLNQDAMLGGSNGAGVMKSHLKQVATDQQGFLTQLKAFRESLVKAEEGIRQAMANYQNTDSLSAKKLS